MPELSVLFADGRIELVAEIEWQTSCLDQLLDIGQVLEASGWLIPEASFNSTKVERRR